MRLPAATRVLAPLVLAVSFSACDERPRDADRQSAPVPAPPTTPPVRAAEPTVAPATGAVALTCFRGGSTPDEVRAVMGPPDSIQFGWWIYGRSQIFFGYGTVQSYENAGNLILC